MLPKNIKKYFWDIDTEKIDLNERRIYILKRLVEYGDPAAISWAWKTFSKKDWFFALKSREVSLSTKNFWASLLSFKK